MVKVKEDMTGWVMSEHGVSDSRLIVIRQAEDYVSPNGTHYARWLCECNCEEHNQIIARGNDIKSGHTLSCGCYHREKTSQCLKKYNKYDLSGEYGIGFAINTNNPFYFDLCDYDLIKDYCWYERVRNGFSSLQTNINNKMVGMHQLLGYSGYDHSNRNELDNRKNNLRNATQKENSRNRSLARNNTSGFIGVWFHRKAEKWWAGIEVDGNKLYLGLFINKEDAIRSRLQAEAKYFGKFAPQRHLFEQYGINTQQNDLEKENQTNDRTN